jgi:NAD(P)-dependent dehydrogenase (short-subunit alcohol dehydrogenase family)
VNNPLRLLRLARFTNVGHRFSDRSPVTASMEGQTVVLTGPTSGLGRAAAEDIAGLGARVVLVGRSVERTNAARDEIAAATGNHDLAVQIADLSIIGDVRHLVDRLLRTEDRIDVLINNAGALFPERAETPEGLERTVALDLLSPFVLTEGLIPRLEGSAPSRIISVTSGGMYGQRIKPSDLQFERGEYGGAAAYARAKRGIVILTETWARRLASAGVVVHSMHPGWADTPGVEESLPRFRALMRPFLRSPEQGADTIVWLAAAAEPAGTTGEFWLDRKPQPTHLVEGTKEAPEEREALIEALEDLAGRV